MDFLYFPDDKSEYIPGIISIIIIFILSILIVWLLMRASRKQVKQLNEQGYPVIYDRGETWKESEQQAPPNETDTTEQSNDEDSKPTKKP